MQFCKNKFRAQLQFKNETRSDKIGKKIVFEAGEQKIRSRLIKKITKTSELFRSFQTRTIVWELCSY